MADHDLSDDLQESLANARIRLAVTERGEEILEELKRNLRNFHRSEDFGQAPHPLERLKIEALSHIYAMSIHHCNFSRFRGEAGQFSESHAWAVDEGYLKAAFDIVMEVQMPTLTDD